MSEYTELFRFVEGSEIFTLTSGDKTITHNSENYDHQYSIARVGNLDIKNDITRQNLDLDMSFDNPVALRYLASPIDTVVTLTTYLKVNGSVNTFWRGRLFNVRANSNGGIRLTFESVFTSMRRMGLRPNFQRLCRHPHYGRGCKLNHEDFAVTATLVSITNGVILTFSDLEGYADNTFRAGMIKGPNNVVRFIRHSSQSTEQCMLTREFESLAQALAEEGGPLTVTLYPGCDRTMDVCETTFSNLPNHGGFPWLPTQQPFGSGHSVM